MVSVAANRFHEVWEADGAIHDRKAAALVVSSSARTGPGWPLTHQVLTYGELLDGAARIASFLAAKGIGRGDRVLFLTPPCLELYQGMLGVLKAGAISAFANPAEKFHDFESCMAHLRPRALFGVAKAHQLRFVSPTLREVEVLVGIGSGSWGFSPPVRFDDILRHWDPAFGTVAVERDDPATVSFTTGTTGRPKGVVRTHQDYGHIFEALSRHPRKREKGTNFCAFPNLPVDDLTAGRTSVLAVSSATDPHGAVAEIHLRQMQDFPPHLVSFPPLPLTRLVEAAIRRGLAFPSVVQLFVGAGPTPPRLLETFSKVFPAAKLSILYGSTEVEPISHLAGEEMGPALEKRIRSGEGLCVGHPEGLEVRICPVSPGPLDHLPDPLPTGRIGEILVTGAHVNREYLDNPEETRRHKVTDGTRTWHRMGDLGALDGEGRIWLHGRVRHAATLDGVEIHPMAVEAMVDRVPGVSKSALVLVELGGLAGSDLDCDPPRLVPAIAIEKEASGDPEAAIRALPLPAPLRDVTIVTTPIPLDGRLGAKIEYEELASRLEPDLRRSRCEPFDRRLKAYLRSRFPVGDTAIGALVFVVGLLAAAGVAGWQDPFRFTTTLVVVLGFFFHLRCFDELKDSAVDRLLYPDRPVSRLVVSLEEIRWCLRLTVAAEALGAAFLGLTPFLWWLAAFLYSCLMRVEFFCREWLRSRILIYGISHVVVVFLLAQFVISTARPGEVHGLAGVVALCLAWFAEIARKLVPRGSETVREEHRLLDESYVRDLGMGRTVLLLLTILATGVAAGAMIGVATGRTWKYQVAILASGALVAAATLRFHRQPDERQGKKAHGASLLWALIQYASLAFTL